MDKPAVTDPPQGQAPRFPHGWWKISGSPRYPHHDWVDQRRVLFRTKGVKIFRVPMESCLGTWVRANPQPKGHNKQPK